MEPSEHWDRLTAALAMPDPRDVEAIWGFLVHTHVIEHAKRGAFDQVIAALRYELERGAATSPECASRIAAHLRDLQTSHGAQPDPGGTAARAQYAVWLAGRHARRSGIIPPPNARAVESGSVTGDLQTTWVAYLIAAPVETVAAKYECSYGKALRDQVRPNALHFAHGNHRLTICPADERDAFPGGGSAAIAAEATFLLISSTSSA